MQERLAMVAQLQYLGRAEGKVKSLLEWWVTDQVSKHLMLFMRKTGLKSQL